MFVLALLSKSMAVTLPWLLWSSMPIRSDSST